MAGRAPEPVSISSRVSQSLAKRQLHQRTGFEGLERIRPVAVLESINPCINIAVQKVKLSDGFISSEDSVEMTRRLSPTATAYAH